MKKLVLLVVLLGLCFPVLGQSKVLTSCTFTQKEIYDVETLEMLYSQIKETKFVMYEGFNMTLETQGSSKITLYAKKHLEDLPNEVGVSVGCVDDSNRSYIVNIFISDKDIMVVVFYKNQCTTYFNVKK